MKRLTVGAVETAVYGLKAEFVGNEGDRQHFVNSLVMISTEISQLRCEYEDLRGDEEPEEDADLSKWYTDDGGYRQAAGVGDFETTEK